MADVYIDVRSDRVSRALRGIGDQAPAAVARALNRSLTTVRAEASKEIRSVLNLPASRTKDAISVHRASPATHVAAIRIAGRQIPLSQFTGTRQTKKGVSVKVKKTGSREVIPGTFLARMASGHVGVFWRRKGSTHRGALRSSPKHRVTYRPELAIDERFSLAVQQVLKEANLSRLIAVAKARFRTEIVREIEFRTARRTGGLSR